MRPNVDQRSESDAVVNARNRIALIGETMGIRHPEYATALNQLALLLIMQGDADAAEPLLRDALDVRRASLGENHPDFATNLSSLGGVLWARGELEAAEPLLRQAAEVRRSALGQGHPKTVVSLNSLDQLQRALRVSRESSLALIVDQPQLPMVPPVADLISPAVGTAPELTSKIAPDGDPTKVLDHFSSVDLETRMDAVHAEFTTVAEQMTRTARGLIKDGEPVSESFSNLCAETRRRFESLQEYTINTLEHLALAFPPEGVNSLDAIKAVFPAVKQAELSRSSFYQAREKALRLLDSAEGLSCPGSHRLESLLACHEQVRSLRATILASGIAEPSDDVLHLAEGSHPLNALLSLVRADEGTADNDWADWYETVEESYGNSLAVAAARSRLEEPKFSTVQDR